MEYGIKIDLTQLKVGDKVALVGSDYFFNSNRSYPTMDEIGIATIEKINKNSIVVKGHKYYQAYSMCQGDKEWQNYFRTYELDSFQDVYCEECYSEHSYDAHQVDGRYLYLASEETARAIEEIKKKNKERKEKAEREARLKEAKEKALDEAISPYRDDFQKAAKPLLEEIDKLDSQIKEFYKKFAKEFHERICKNCGSFDSCMWKLDVDNGSYWIEPKSKINGCQYFTKKGW